LLHFLPAPIKGLIACLLFFENTVFWCLALYLLALLRLIPVQAWRERCYRAMIWVAETWIAINSAEIAFLHNMKWNIHLPDGLSLEKSYLVISNHQSWVDIVAIQHVLNRRIPFLRFFLKDQLRYVPFLGVAWKALDFPFMKRYSREFLEKHPEKRGEDLIETKRACEKLRGKPISILNFLEGTRFSTKKQERMKSPFKHLLTPKTGGIAFVIEAMGDQFDSILDITIQYPNGAGSFWDLFTGRIPEITVWVESIPIPGNMLGGNYFGDDAFRSRMQTWIQQIWLAKDQRLS
jgi:1-acyl-sn-glycerol-3-phosphate acyltransferase